MSVDRYVIFVLLVIYVKLDWVFPITKPSYADVPRAHLRTIPILECKIPVLNALQYKTQTSLSFVGVKSFYHFPSKS